MNGVSSAILVNPPAGRLGECNAVMSGRVPIDGARLPIVRDFEGPLSIKFMFEGTGLWDTPDGDYRITGGAYVVLNAGQRYGLEIEGGGRRESFCPMFARGFVEEVARSMVTGADELLHAPCSKDGFHAPTFSEHVRDADPFVTPRLHALRNGVRAGADGLWLEERFHDLAEALLRSESEWRAAAARVPAGRANTRDELWRRVHRARDFIHAHATEALDLERIARAASLAPHHFHRVYRAAFGETPHRTVTRLRLERALVLLRRADASVTRVCFELGFQSPTSFSSLFRRELGVTPVSYLAGQPPIRKIREAKTAADA